MSMGNWRSAALWAPLFLLLAGLPSSKAQSAAGPITGAKMERVGVISFNEAVLNTSEAKRELAALQKKFAPTEAHLRELNSEAENLKSQLNSGKTTDAEHNTLLHTLETTTKQLQRESQDFQNDSQAESEDVFQTVARKVYSFLQSYAQRSGYALIVDRGAEDRPIVWYAAPSTDITADVTGAFDAASATPSAPTPHQ